MDMITVTAKTVDEAVTKALIELETTSDKLEYEVVEKGSAGNYRSRGIIPAHQGR
jgi:spoIIIJ-associated protein